MKCWRRRARYLTNYKGYDIYYRRHSTLRRRRTYFIRWHDYGLDEVFCTKPFRSLLAAYVYIDKRMDGMFL